ncbi:MAG: hypothetical protein E7536_11030 [Ruminococcaceae bacterium]|nr:hypothetical protein [Oscillospiraceae bacterium]
MAFDKKAGRNLTSEKGIFSSVVSCYLFPLIVFGGYLLYCILEKLIPSASGYYLIHYLYTFEKGYISRGFVGEIISKFTDTVTDDITRTVITIFSALLMLGMTLCIGKALSKVRFDKERLTYVLFVAVVVFMIPMPFKYFYTDIKLDKLVWALTLFAVYLADNKIGKWLVPVICALATVVNPIFVFTSMILIAIIILQEFYSGGMSKKDGILCGVTYIAIIALALFAPISEKWVDFANAGEMVDFFFKRYAGELEPEYRERFINMWLIDFFMPVDKALNTSFHIYFENFGRGLNTALNLIFVAIPFYTVMGIFWKKVIKAEKDKIQKIIYFLSSISIVAAIPAIILSWEFSKYLYNHILVQAGLIVYFVVKDHKAVVDTCKEAKEFGKKHLIASIAGILYFLTFFATLYN